MPHCPQCASVCEDGHKFCAACGAELPAEPPPSSSRADPMIGRTLPGGYRVQHLAGIGGMGRVYLAEQTALGRTVAVKVIHPHLVGDENAAGRFITEARAASRLNHPNSIAIFDFGSTTDGQLYLVMEFLRGKDLARVMHEEGPLGTKRIVDIVRQMLAGLEEAHEMSIIHRDLKPENIILEPLRSGRDVVKVVDYGLAKMRTGAPLTSPGFVCGTPEYMSPEQCRGDVVDARADLYAVGVILFQLLVGHLPFEGENSTKVLMAHLTEAAPDPRVVAPFRRISDALAMIVLRALEKNPDLRFTDAREFTAALDDALRDSERWDSTPTATVHRCPSCGVLNATAQKYCGDCGAPISETALQKATPRPATPSPASLGGDVTLAELPLLAREEELRWLEARRDEAAVLPCNARLVGVTGIGKTRLLREFSASCASRGDYVVETGPDPSGGEIVGYSLRDVIARLAGGTVSEWTASGDAQDGLDDLFGAVSPEVRITDTRAPADRRRGAAHALRWAMERASERERELVVILADDLDELDGVSRNAFVDVMTEPPVLPLLFVVTYASDPSRSVVFPGEEYTVMPIPAAVAAPLLVVAESVLPLELEQRLRWARETSEAPPATLTELIARRINRLPEAARARLQERAVLGDDVEMQDDGALVAAGFLRGGVLAHPLFRDLALATAPAGVRRELHASALDLRRDAPIEVRAIHACEAERVFEALMLLERVSAERARRGDAAGRIDALRRALELSRREIFRGELDDPLRAVVLFSRKLADALAESTAYADAEGVLREALDVTTPNDADRAHMLASLAQIAHARAHAHDAKSYLEEAKQLARKSDARELLRSLETLERAIA